jgi:small GTP-binding protein
MIADDIDRKSSFQARVVMLGDSTVGKTSILNRLISSTFSRFESPTIVSNFQIHKEKINNMPVELQIWDTAGQEKFRALGPIYYRNAAGAVLVYDQTSRDTFHHLQQWVDVFRQIAGYRTAVVVAANKADLPNTQVSLEEAEEWASACGFPIQSSSALTGVGVAELFTELAKALLGEQTQSKAVDGKRLDGDASGGCGC